MKDLTKLAARLDTVGASATALSPDSRMEIINAARILRSAAAGDVQNLIDNYGLAVAKGDRDATIKYRAALESALRLALAARDDDVFTALDMSPDTFRTEGGAVNVGKLRAAIRHPADYLPPDHWLAAAAPKGTT